MHLPPPYARLVRSATEQHAVLDERPVYGWNLDPLNIFFRWNIWRRTKNGKQKLPTVALRIAPPAEVPERVAGTGSACILCRRFAEIRWKCDLHPSRAHIYSLECTLIRLLRSPALSPPTLKLFGILSKMGNPSNVVGVQGGGTRC